MYDDVDEFYEGNRKVVVKSQTITCEYCKGYGFYYDEYIHNYTCTNCYGEGFVTRTTKEYINETMDSTSLS